MGSSGHLRAAQLRREDILAASAHRRLVAQARVDRTAATSGDRSPVDRVRAAARLILAVFVPRLLARA